MEKTPHRGYAGAQDASILALSPRERLVLTAIIEHYVATGEPVASQLIAQQQNKEGMSSATIRNVMADLGEAGLLEQPHTSAGRIPTARAFRFYVGMLGQRQLPLALQHREQIHERYAGVASAQDFLERTSHVLAQASQGVGVTAVTTGTADTLEHIHFTRLSACKVLAIVVTRAGNVRDRLLLMDREISQAELDGAGNYLNANFHGWALDKVRAEVCRRVDQERSEYDRMLQALEELWRKGALERGGGQSVFVEGVANLIGSEADRQRLRQILMAIEEKQRLADLLDAYVDARQESVRVVIGLEEAMPEMGNFVLIGAPARVGGEVMGSVAVIGPTRMNYENAMQTVSYVAQLFDRLVDTRDSGPST